MEVRFFAIYDEKGLVYKNPFTFPHRGQAVRVFAELANDPRTEIGRHPEDFVLYEIGTFDDVSGELGNVTNVVLHRALELVDLDGPIPDGSSN